MDTQSQYSRRRLLKATTIGAALSMIGVAELSSGIAHAASTIPFTGTSVDAVFHQVMSTPNSSAVISMTSNQPDGLVTATLSRGFTVFDNNQVARGILKPISGSALQGSSLMLFSDRSLYVPDPNQQPGGFDTGNYQPFSDQATSPVTITLTLLSSGTYQLELNISGLNRDFQFPLNLIGDLAYGVTAAIGNSEPVAHATHLISLLYSPPPPPIN